MATHASLANPISISMDWEQPAPEYGAVRGMNISACWLLSNGISRGKKDRPHFNRGTESAKLVWTMSIQRQQGIAMGKIHGDSLHIDERVDEILLAMLNPSLMRSEDRP